MKDKPFPNHKYFSWKECGLLWESFTDDNNRQTYGDHLQKNPICKMTSFSDKKARANF